MLQTCTINVSLGLQDNSDSDKCSSDESDIVLSNATDEEQLSKEQIEINGLLRRLNDTYKYVQNIYSDIEYVFNYKDEIRDLEIAHLRKSNPKKFINHLNVLLKIYKFQLQRDHYDHDRLRKLHDSYLEVLSEDNEEVTITCSPFDLVAAARSFATSEMPIWEDQVEQQEQTAFSKTPASVVVTPQAVKAAQRTSMIRPDSSTQSQPLLETQPQQQTLSPPPLQTQSLPQAQQPQEQPVAQAQQQSADVQATSRRSVSAAQAKPPVSHPLFTPGNTQQRKLAQVR